MFARKNVLFCSNSTVVFHVISSIGVCFDYVCLVKQGFFLLSKLNVVVEISSE